MYSHHRRKARIVFAVSDVLLAALAFVAAYRTRAVLPFPRFFEINPVVQVLLLTASATVWVLLGRWLGVYERVDSKSWLVRAHDATRQCFLGGIFIILLQYSLRLDLSRSFLGLFLIYLWIGMILFRARAAWVASILTGEHGYPHSIILVGTGTQAKQLGALLEASAGREIRLLGFLSDSEPAPAEVELSRPYPVYPLAQLSDLLRRNVIDEIVFAVESERLGKLEDVFLLCDEEGVRTRVALGFFPHVNSEVYLDRFGDAPLLTFSAAPHDDIRLVMKRLNDILISAMALALLLPLMAAIALMIHLTSGGPVIFRQERCGLNGRRFVFYKFRSMVANAEELKAGLAHLSHKQIAFKIARDPRVTPFGWWLRKFSIDEWPQLWNVLRGDMSLVGPRPAVPEEVENYARWQRRRLRMRPGLTCLWAVSGRDALDFDTWMKLDMQYIDNWSLSLDWKILLRTVPYVLLGKGAH